MTSESCRGTHATYKQANDDSNDDDDHDNHDDTF